MYLIKACEKVNFDMSGSGRICSIMCSMSCGQGKFGAQKKSRSLVHKERGWSLYRVQYVYCVLWIYTVCVCMVSGKLLSIYLMAAGVRVFSIIF